MTLVLVGECKGGRLRGCGLVVWFLYGWQQWVHLQGSSTSTSSTSSSTVVSCHRVVLVRSVDWMGLVLVGSFE